MLIALVLWSKMCPLGVSSLDTLLIFFSGYRRVQIVQDEFLGKRMPVIKPEQLSKPSVTKKALSNTRELISKFYSNNPEKLDHILSYYNPASVIEEEEKTKKDTFSPFAFLKSMFRVSAHQKRCSGVVAPVVSRRSKHFCSKTSGIVPVEISKTSKKGG